MVPAIDGQPEDMPTSASASLSAEKSVGGKGKSKPAAAAGGSSRHYIARWTPEEDAILLEHVMAHGTSQWGLLQRSGRLPLRDNKACCNRFILLKRKFLAQEGGAADFPPPHPFSSASPGLSPGSSPPTRVRALPHHPSASAAADSAAFGFPPVFLDGGPGISIDAATSHEYPAHFLGFEPETDSFHKAARASDYGVGAAGVAGAAAAPVEYFSTSYGDADGFASILNDLGSMVTTPGGKERPERPPVPLPLVRRKSLVQAATAEASVHPCVVPKTTGQGGARGGKVTGREFSGALARDAARTVERCECKRQRSQAFATDDSSPVSNDDAAAAAAAAASVRLHDGQASRSSSSCISSSSNNGRKRKVSSNAMPAMEVDKRAMLIWTPVVGASATAANVVQPAAAAPLPAAATYEESFVAACRAKVKAEETAVSETAAAAAAAPAEVEADVHADAEADMDAFLADCVRQQQQQMSVKQQQQRPLQAPLPYSDLLESFADLAPCWPSAPSSTPTGIAAFAHAAAAAGFTAPGFCYSAPSSGYARAGYQHGLEASLAEGSGMQFYDSCPGGGASSAGLGVAGPGAAARHAAAPCFWTSSSGAAAAAAAATSSTSHRARGGVDAAMAEALFRPDMILEMMTLG